MTIWKFPFPVGDDVIIAMPDGARVLSVQTQGDQPCVWAMVDETAAPMPRYFRVLGTGHPFPDADRCTFIGTFQLAGGALIFHLFEKR